tara:strand:+ start:516 stop:1055 length:540 start_codon:yes stop_codon:yes gene_type:complete
MPSVYQLIVKLCIQWELPEEVQQRIYNSFKNTVLSYRCGDINPSALGICNGLRGYSEWSMIPRSHLNWRATHRTCDLQQKIKVGRYWVRREGLMMNDGISAKCLFNTNSTTIKLYPLKLSVYDSSIAAYDRFDRCDYRVIMPSPGGYSKAKLYELCEEAGLPYKKYWNRTKLLELLLNY